MSKDASSSEWVNGLAENQDSSGWSCLMKHWGEKLRRSFSNELGCLWAFTGPPSFFFMFCDRFPKLWSAIVASEALKTENRQLRKELRKYLNCSMNLAEAEMICIHEWFVWKVVTFQGSCKQIELVWMVTSRAGTMTHSRIYWNNYLWLIFPITCSAIVMTVPASSVA